MKDCIRIEMEIQERVAKEMAKMEREMEEEMKRRQEMQREENERIEKEKFEREVTQRIAEEKEKERRRIEEEEKVEREVKIRIEAERERLEREMEEKKEKERQMEEKIKLETEKRIREEIEREVALRLAMERDIEEKERLDKNMKVNGVIEGDRSTTQIEDQIRDLQIEEEKRRIEKELEEKEKRLREIGEKEMKELEERLRIEKERLEKEALEKERALRKQLSDLTNNNFETTTSNSQRVIKSVSYPENFQLTQLKDVNRKLSIQDIISVSISKEQLEDMITKEDALFARIPDKIKILLAEQSPPYVITEGIHNLFGNISKVCRGAVGRLYEFVILTQKELATTAAKGLVPLLQKVMGILNHFADILANSNEKNFFITVSYNINASLKPLLLAVKNHLNYPNSENRTAFELSNQTLITHLSSLNRSSIAEFSQLPTNLVTPICNLTLPDAVTDVEPEFIPTKFCGISGAPIYPGMKFLQYKDKCYLWENFKCEGSGELIGEREFIFIDEKFYLRDFYQKSQNLLCAGTGKSLIGVPFVTFEGKNYEESYFRSHFPDVHICPPEVK